MCGLLKVGDNQEEYDFTFPANIQACSPLSLGHAFFSGGRQNDEDKVASRDNPSLLLSNWKQYYWL